MTSHVTANLDQWVENGFINAEQREAIAQLIENACCDASEAGYAEGYYDANREASSSSYGSGYDDGYSVGYDEGQFERGN
jgi:flagellar biosynthesis/type III secretory pathway protein FliH